MCAIESLFNGTSANAYLCQMVFFACALEMMARQSNYACTQIVIVLGEECHAPAHITLQLGRTLNRRKIVPTPSLRPRGKSDE